MSGRSIVVLVAHGTVSTLDELPAFVTEIRRGRPPTPELLAELHERYAKIGGSPLLADTLELGRRLAAASGLEVRVAMRLWKPRLRDVVADLDAGDRVLLVPLAPFSVDVYHEAARRELASLGERAPRLECVGAWGLEAALLEGWYETIRSALAEVGGDAEVILTAHSLPMVVVRGGDRYPSEVAASASALAELLGRPVRLAYQSQGAMEGEWLGPKVEDVLEELRLAGVRRFVVAPIGFLSEHVETLYDLDVELRARVESTGGALARAKTVYATPGLEAALVRLVERAWGSAGAERRESARN